MKKYERDLKKLIQLSKDGCRLVPDEESGLTEPELRSLSALGLVKLFPIGDNHFAVRVEKACLAYFIRKAESRASFFAGHAAQLVVGFLSGFLSGILVTLVAQYLAR